MHFVLKPNYGDEGSFTRASFVNAKEFVNVKLSLGQPLGKSFPLIRINVESDVEPNDYFVAGPIVVVSSKVAEVLQTLKANAELIPVQLTHQGRPKSDRQFFFFNILEYVNCLDYERAKYSLDDGVIDKIQSLVIDEAKLENKPIARLANAYDTVILADEQVRHKFTIAALTGMDFLSPEKWRW